MTMNESTSKHELELTLEPLDGVDVPLSAEWIAGFAVGLGVGVVIGVGVAIT
jgi:hypothetical protein